MPAATATSEAMAAPETPNARPVPQPKIRIGARTMLMTTVITWTSIGALNAPVPRSAAAIVASTNCSASAGTNQRR
jgi:hypothetical protein